MTKNIISKIATVLSVVAVFAVSQAHAKQRTVGGNALRSQSGSIVQSGASVQSGNGGGVQLDYKKDQETGETVVHY